MPPLQHPYADQRGRADVYEALTEQAALPAPSRRLRRKLWEYNSPSPQFSAGDIDAAWEQPRSVEETGGSAPTPNRSVVDERGDASRAHADGERPGFDRQMLERDWRRWEIYPAAPLPDPGDDEEDEDDHDFPNEDDEDWE